MDGPQVGLRLLFNVLAYADSLLNQLGNLGRLADQ